MGNLKSQPSGRRRAGLELGIYRDLALGCAYEGGEVWARPELYATSVSLGAPPDPFAGMVRSGTCRPSIR